MNSALEENFIADMTSVESYQPVSLSTYFEQKKSISIIFPAFNEQSNIVQAVERCLECVHNYFSAFEIIIVNDGSSDNTGLLIDQMAGKYPNVIPLHHERNRGYGAALRSGISNANMDLIFFTDSDLQFDLQELKYLVRWIPVYDIVAGYRVKRADPLHRRFNAWGWNKLVRFSLGLQVRDIDCAFKLFHREVFSQVELESVGAMINTEILCQATWKGMHIKELPVNHYPRQAGEQTGANPRVIVKALRELLQMRGKLKKLSAQRNAFQRLATGTDHATT